MGIQFFPVLDVIVHANKTGADLALLIKCASMGCLSHQPGQALVELGVDVKPIELKSVIQMVDVLNGLKIFVAVKGVSVISGPLLYLKKNNPFYPEEGIYKMANLAANLSKHSFINSLNIVVKRLCKINGELL